MPKIAQAPQKINLSADDLKKAHEFFDYLDSLTEMSAPRCLCLLRNILKGPWQSPLIPYKGYVEHLYKKIHLSLLEEHFAEASERNDLPTLRALHGKGKNLGLEDFRKKVARKYEDILWTVSKGGLTSPTLVEAFNDVLLANDGCLASPKFAGKLFARIREKNIASQN